MNLERLCDIIYLQNFKLNTIKSKVTNNKDELDYKNLQIKTLTLQLDYLNFLLNKELELRNIYEQNRKGM